MKTIWSSNASEEKSELPNYQKKIIWPFNRWKKRSQPLSHQKKVLYPSVHGERINPPSNYPKKTTTSSGTPTEVKRFPLERNTFPDLK
jgi:hypothetical protein